MSMTSRLRRARPLVALAIMIALSGCGGGARDTATPANPEALKVGLVFDIGGRGDKSFNDAAYAGLDSARKVFGIELQTLETGEGADREAQMRQLAANGSDLVFGVGFLFSDDIKTLAQEFPNVKFACVDYTLKDGETLPANLAALKFKEEEGSYLVGALAALTSRTNTVGFVGGMEIPLIKKFEAGYVAGVHAVRPRTKVLIKYAGTTGSAFKDPTKGKELALAEYHQGADVIFHASGSTGLGVFEAARELSKLAIGVDADQNDEAPGFILTSMVKRVENAVFDTIRDTKNGNFTSGVQVFGLAERGVDWVYDDRNRALIPDANKAVVDSLKGLIIAGRITVPSQ